MTLDSDHSSPSRQNSDGEGDNFGGDASLMTHVNRRAMATEFAVILPAHLADAVELVVEALEQLDAIESALTIYREDSEVSRANRLAADRAGGTFARDIRAA